MANSGIQVAIRVRPLNEQERSNEENDGVAAWVFDRFNITAKSRHGGSAYHFDRVFGPSSRTSELYDEIAEKVIAATLGGINGTVFAYGQTSSGKTHTMYGDESEPGVIPRAVQQIFEHVGAANDREYFLRVSFMEIYNEKIRDLLDSAEAAVPLKIHEDEIRGVFVGDLTEEMVVSAQQVLDLLRSGEKRRQIGRTNMNEMSSRSHTIFRMTIESRAKVSTAGGGGSAAGAGQHSNGGRGHSLGGGGAVMVSQLNLVDLAGSERVAHTKAEGERLKEGSHINTSLLTLGTVIAKLTENPNGHIPYRSSKLTRILQPSLGGNSMTAIVCTITPAPVHRDETHSTLKFANRAKNIKNKPVVNEVLDDAAMLRKYRDEIAQLKKALRDLEQDNASQQQQLQQQPQVSMPAQSHIFTSSEERFHQERIELERRHREEVARLKQLIFAPISSKSPSSPGAAPSSNLYSERSSASNATSSRMEGRIPEADSDESALLIVQRQQQQNSPASGKPSHKRSNHRRRPRRRRTWMPGETSLAGIGSEDELDKQIRAVQSQPEHSATKDPKSSMQQLQEERDSYRIRLENVEEQLDSLRTELHERERAHSAAAALASALREQLASAQAGAALAQARGEQIEELETEVQRLQWEALESQRRETEQEASCEGAQQQSLLQDELRALEERAAKVSKARDDLAARLAQKVARIDTLSSEGARLNTRLSAAERVSAALEVECASLRKQLAEQQAEFTELDEERSEAEARADMFRKQLELLQESAERVEAALVEMEAQRDQAWAEARAARSAEKEARDELTAERSRWSLERENAQRRLAEAAEFRAATAAMSDEAHRSQALEAELARVNSSIEHLQAEHAAMGDALRRNEAELREKNATAREAAERAGAQDAVIADVKSQLAVATKQLKRTTVELNKTKRKLEMESKSKQRLLRSFADENSSSPQDCCEE